AFQGRRPFLNGLALIRRLFLLSLSERRGPQQQRQNQCCVRKGCAHVAPLRLMGSSLPRMLFILYRRQGKRNGQAAFAVESGSEIGSGPSLSTLPPVPLERIRQFRRGENRRIFVGLWSPSGRF